MHYSVQELEAELPLPLQNKPRLIHNIITARIRRMREGTVFSLSFHTSMRGVGGYRILPIGGTPIPGQDWGYQYPRSGWGVSLSQVRIVGIPIPGQDRGVPPS